MAAYSLAPPLTAFLPMARWLSGHFNCIQEVTIPFDLSNRNRFREESLPSSFNNSSQTDMLVAYELISGTSGSIYETSLSCVANWCHKFQSPLPLRNANNETSSKSSNNFYCWLDWCLSNYSKLMADLRVLKNSCHREIHLQTNTQYAPKFDLLQI